MTGNVRKFQSTFPMQGTTIIYMSNDWDLGFQSTFPMQGTTYTKRITKRGCNISIHVPNVGNDPVVGHVYDIVAISIHVPNVGNDIFRIQIRWLRNISIHVPNVGNDQSLRREKIILYYFNPRSQCRERPLKGTATCRGSYFNPRSQCRERQCREYYIAHYGNISIHVPNVGNDLRHSTRPRSTTYFNPRSQCRERQLHKRKATNLTLISIHVPNVGNDSDSAFSSTAFAISIHVPNVGNDDSGCISSEYIYYFNPRSQCRERQQTYPNINLKQHYICNILRFSFNIFSSLIYIVIQYSIFVQLFWCESPGIFMYTSYSHYQIAI